ncbi:MAG TPA: hypothetical protein ENJ16_02725 [Planctomycetaceae bacterium]|nr:hypothetical protein [Planctomycetaceae bacterium]
MKIIRLKSENVKRLSAVEIAPDGSAVIVAGRNGQGKSSVLDSILYALGGKKAIPDQPVRHGETKAVVELDLGEFHVRRSMTANGGGTLTVKSKDGGSYGQALLDKLLAGIALDPVAFQRMKPSEQAETLRQLVGLDLTEHEEAEREAYQERTIVNRTIASLRARLDAMPEAEEILPEEAPDATEIINAIREADEAAAKKTRLEEDIHRKRSARTRKLEEIERLKMQVEDLNASINALMVEVDAIEVKDTEDLRDQLNRIDEIRRKVEANKARNAVAEELQAEEKRAANLTVAIEGLRQARARRLAECKMPVEGLSIEGGRVTYNGVPFDQASSAEQLRVSVAMALAAKPDLRVILIRDGSLLDADSLRMVAEMAEESDAQVWIERVGTNDEGAIVIEDGAIVDDSPADLEAAP